MPNTSRYTVVVDNLSSTTRTADLDYEFKYCGKIRDIVRDAKARCALIEFHRAADADYAYRKMHGMVLHGRQLRVEFATKSDFKFFGWKWMEGSPSPPPSSSRGRVISRSVSRSRSRSRSASY